jgi:hypothetical protein
VSVNGRILGDNCIGGVLASIWAFIARGKRAVIPDVTLNAGQHTSANEEYALAA